MSDASPEQGISALDMKLLARFDGKREIAVAVEMLANSIAPRNIDFSQRARIENALSLLVDLILIEAEASAVARLGGGQ